MDPTKNDQERQMYRNHEVLEDVIGVKHLASRNANMLRNCSSGFHRASTGAIPRIKSFDFFCTVKSRKLRFEKLSLTIEGTQFSHYFGPRSPLTT